MMSLDIPFPIFSVFERVLCEFKPDSDVQSEWVQFMNQRLKTYFLECDLNQKICYPSAYLYNTKKNSHLQPILDCMTVKFMSMISIGF